MSFRRSVAVALALLLLAPTAVALALPTAEATFLVGHEPGQRDAVLFALSLLGGRADVALDGVQALRVKVPSDVGTDRLAAIPGVAFVERDARTVGSGAQWNGAQWDGAQWNGAQWDGAQWNGAQWNGERIHNGTEWGHRVVRTPEAWAVQTGSGAANLCVVDSGIDASHPDLAQNAVVLGYDAFTRSTAATTDEAGHGTHVAGIAAAVRDDAGTTGVSQSRILGAKVLDATGQGTVTTLTLGLQWCMDVGADVVLLALSVDGTSKTVRRALDLLEKQGVVVVASAGNKGPCSECVSFPANQATVLAVTAIGQDGALAPFSSTGSQADLAAPGVGVISTFDGGAYAAGSGTSQAAAWVAGAAALLREHRPDLPPAQVRDALRQGAADAGVPGQDPAYGAGVLDVAGALRALEG